MTAEPTKLSKAVFRLIKRVPKGKLTTYKLLAQACRQPKAFRAVGNILKTNTQLIVVPCHRVVKSDGRIGGYRQGRAKKIYLLKQEGIQIKANRILEFKGNLYKF